MAVMPSRRMDRYVSECPMHGEVEPLIVGSRAKCPACGQFIAKASPLVEIDSGMEAELESALSKLSTQKELLAIERLRREQAEGEQTRLRAERDELRSRLREAEAKPRGRIDLSFSPDDERVVARCSGCGVTGSRELPGARLFGKRLFPQI